MPLPVFAGQGSPRALGMWTCAHTCADLGRPARRLGCVQEVPRRALRRSAACAQVCAQGTVGASAQTCSLPAGVQSVQRDPLRCGQFLLLLDNSENKLGLARILRRLILGYYVPRTWPPVLELTLPTESRYACNSSTDVPISSSANSVSQAFASVRLAISA